MSENFTRKPGVLDGVHKKIEKELSDKETREEVRKRIMGLPLDKKTVTSMLNIFDRSLSTNESVLIEDTNVVKSENSNKTR